MKLAIIILFFAVVAAEMGQKNYKNHKVLSLRIENNEQLLEIQSLESESGVRKFMKNFEESKNFEQSKNL